MAVSESKLRANKKYKDKFVYLQTRLSIEERETINGHAVSMGESVNGFVRRAIFEAIERDRAKRENTEV